MLYLVAVLVGWDADRCLQSDLMTKSRLRNVEKLVFDDRTRLVDGRNNAPVIPTPTPLRLVRGSTPVKFEPFDLLSLAIEFDGEELELSSVGPAVNGNLSVLQNGSIIFEADPQFVGRASFEFTVNDPAGSKAVGTVRFNVKPTLPADPLFETQWHHDQTRVRQLQPFTFIRYYPAPRGCSRGSRGFSRTGDGQITGRAPPLHEPIQRYFGHRVAERCL